MTATNPPVGKFINWKSALVGSPASSNALGKPLVKTFNHLRRYRAMEFLASYSGRYDPAINGDWASRFHIISRFPVRNNGTSDAQIGINLKAWKIGRPVAGPINLLINWRKLLGGGVTTTLRDCFIPVAAASDDGINDKPNGIYGEWAVEVTPEAIGTADGFRCSRLDVDNLVVHRLNVFGCPHDPMLDDDEALVKLSDMATGEVLRGWDQGNDDGTIGALCHYMDAGDSVIHNSSRALFNTTYALGIHQTGVAAHNTGHLRQDSAGNAMSYRVAARNLTGNVVDDIPCDVAVVLMGDASCEVQLASVTAGDTSTITIPAGGYATPTLVTTSHAQCTGALNIDPAGDTITITGISPAGINLYVNAVSLWEPYQHR